MIDVVGWRIDSLERKMRLCFSGFAQRMDSMERRFEQMHERFGNMRVQFDSHHTGYRRLLLLPLVQFMSR